MIDGLRSGGLSVVTAESCTAGLVAAVLSHGADASECLHGGFVAYTKSQKSEALGVDKALLKTRGSVNEEVARQLAEGALRNSTAALALSVTGVLGPNPDEDGNVPGIVYLGLARRGSPTLVVQKDFRALAPDEVRRATVVDALELLLRATQGRDAAGT